MTEQQARRWSVVVGLLLLAAFAVFFPIAKSGLVGRGSDLDDSYNRAVHALLSGRYPYEPRTYLGGEISAMPGSIVMAVPFVLLGTAAFQVPFWLAVGFFVVRKVLGDTREAFLGSVAVLLLSPTVVHSVVTGIDHVSVGALVAVAAYGVCRARGWWITPAAIFFGLALSSRPNFSLVAFPVLSYLNRAYGRRESVRRMAIAFASFALITVPYFVLSPEEFSPIASVERLTRFGNTAAVTVPIAALLGTIYWAFRRQGSSLTDMFEAMALSQGCLVMAGTLLGLIQTGVVDLWYMNYFSFCTVPGVLAWWTIATEARKAVLVAAASNA